MSVSPNRFITPTRTSSSVPFLSIISLIAFPLHCALVRIYFRFRFDVQLFWSIGCTAKPCPIILLEYSLNYYVFSDVTSCGLVDRYRRFGGNKTSFAVLPWGKSWYTSTKIHGVISQKTASLMLPTLEFQMLFTLLGRVCKIFAKIGYQFFCCCDVCPSFRVQRLGLYLGWVFVKFFQFEALYLDASTIFKFRYNLIKK